MGWDGVSSFCFSYARCSLFPYFLSCFFFLSLCSALLSFWFSLQGYPEVVWCAEEGGGRGKERCVSFASLYPLIELNLPSSFGLEKCTVQSRDRVGGRVAERRRRSKGFEEGGRETRRVRVESNRRSGSRAVRGRMNDQKRSEEYIDRRYVHESCSTI